MGIQVPPDSNGKVVDTVTLSDAGSDVHRQKVVIAGASGTAEVVATSLSAPAVSAMGLVVRQAGTVNVAVATPFIVQGISTTVNVAVATPFIVQGISTTVTVAGVVNLSATANVAVRSIYVTGAVPSASRGPRCVVVSTSANTTLVAAPGANMAIFVTQVNCTNASGTNTRARIGTSASIGQVTMMMAQSGGGFLAQYVPIWKLSTNEALVGSVKPNVSEGIFNIHFFVASADAL
jgi:hypothetical protein